MKRAYTIATFILIFSLSFVCSAGVEPELTKTEFYQGEILKTEIIGVFLENLKLENVNIYEQGKVHPSPLGGSGLHKLENTYIYYALLPSKIGNYSLKIEDIKYYYGQEIRENTTEVNFTILSTLDPYLSADKGYIVASTDFEIKIKSLNGIQEVTVTFEDQKITKEIGYNLEKTFSFSIAEFKEYTKTPLIAGDLEIPVYVYPRSTPPEPLINGTENQSNPFTNHTQDPPETTPLEDATPQQIQSCADVDAKLCKKSEECQGPLTFVKDTVCCAGECVEQPKSYTWVWAIVILIILAAGGYWFYKKSKSKQRASTKKEPIKEKTQEFQQRMNPNLMKGPEIRKGLSRQ